MKKISIKILLLILAPLSLFSQNIKTATKKLSIGLSYEQDICYRQLNYSGTDIAVEEIRSRNEKFRFGFTTGINFRYRLSNKISLESAVLYANTGSKTKTQDLLWATADNNLPDKNKTVFVLKHCLYQLK